MEIPRIISVDDHVVEPPDLWTSRLPERMRERGPRLLARCPRETRSLRQEVRAELHPAKVLEALDAAE